MHLKFLIAGIAIFASSAMPAPDLRAADVKERPLVAVMPFEYKADSKEYAGTEKGLAEALATELVKTKTFRLIERGRIDTLLQEAAVQQTGLTDPSKAVAVGKQLGATAYILGSVTAVSLRDEFRSVKFAEKTTRFAEVEAEAKLVDVETGEILASGRAVGKAKTAEKHAFGAKTGELATKESVTQKALMDLSKKLSKDLNKTYKNR